MARQVNRRAVRALTLRNLMLAVALIGVVGSAGLVVWKRRGHRLPPMTTAVVHRQNLEIKLRAGGRVESTKKTLIECELERLSYNANGSSLSAGGSTTILEVIPDGTTVHRDDVICRLDSSAYEELVRQQEIKVEESRSEYRRAELDLQAVEAGLREYRDGLMAQTRTSFRGNIALNRADLKKQEDRLKWSRDMLAIGYLPSSKIGDEERAYMKLQNTLEASIRDRDHFENFGAPRVLSSHESKVYNAATSLRFAEHKLKRHEERLAKFQEQVELCTIRAPHDGFLIYANEPDDDPRIEVGAQVRQRQDLFYLPDLSRMEAETLLHESVLRKVREGMPAKVRVEALPQFVLEGRVVGVAPLPTYRSVPSSLDVLNYIGHVQLNGIPEGVFPGMTAEVEILTETHLNALVIPTEALGFDSGREYCFVARDDVLERRSVTVGETSENLLEVTAGLSEGEQVVLNPSTSRGKVAGEHGEIGDREPRFGDPGTADSLRTVSETTCAVSGFNQGIRRSARRKRSRGDRRAACRARVCLAAIR